MKTYLSKESLILLIATLLLLAGCYFPLFPEGELYVITVVLYLLVTPLIVLILLRENLKEYGFAWKKWPFSKGKTVLGLVILVAVMYVINSFPEHKEFYTSRIQTENLLIHTTLIMGLYYFAEEFFFRGFLLFGLKERFGEFSVVIQTIPFALFHLGKPPSEAILSVFAGLVFGHIAYKSESFIPVFLLHWLMGLCTVAFVAL